jgi:hypothetical protein
MVRTTEPRRLCEYYPNKNIGRNVLTAELPSLREHFGEILHDKTLLRAAYVHNRYSADNGRAMNQANPGQFSNNRVAQWSQRDRVWAAQRAFRNIAANVKRIVFDTAELSVLDELFRIFGQLGVNLPSTSTAYPATSRLLFVQGGIGCGKSTMLHHLFEVTVPDLHAQNLLPRPFAGSVTDFNAHAEDSPPDVTWRKVLADFRKGVETASGLKKTPDWHSIARDEIFDEDGTLRPIFATSPQPRKKMLEAINRSADDVTYVARVARFLAKRDNGVLVFVLDNIDCLPSARRQLAFVKRFVEFLDAIGPGVGIVTVREYTLGNLSGLRDFAAFQYVNRLHMTTPYLGEAVQKRFQVALAAVTDDSARLVRVPIGEGVASTQFDVKQILTHISSAFDDPGVRVLRKPRRSTRMEDLGLRNVPVFLNNITNSNMRLCLGFVLEALDSWAFPSGKVVRDYYYRRDTGQRWPVGPFTVDELFPAAAVGGFEFYDHRLCTLVQNVFATGEVRPNWQERRFPLLHVYRILQLVGGRGQIGLGECLDMLSCFPFHRAENWSILQSLLDQGFVESLQGSRLESIETLCATRKLIFYLDVFSCSLVYIEMVRNDSYIEYDSEPHKVGVCRTVLAEDMIEAFKFIWYVMEQETQQYVGVKASKARVSRFRQIVEESRPICWKMLCGVVAHGKELYQRNPRLLPTSYHRDLEAEFLKVRDEIIKRGRDGQLYPEVFEAPMALGLVSP